MRSGSVYGSANDGELRRLLTGLEKGRYLAAQLLLDRHDRPARVDAAEVEFVGHGAELPQHLVLIRPEAVVDVIAQLHVHTGFPEVHPANSEHAADKGFDVNLQIEGEVRRDREAVEVAEPLPVYAAHSSARECREDVAVRQNDEA